MSLLMQMFLSDDSRFSAEDMLVFATVLFLLGRWGG